MIAPSPTKPAEPHTGLPPSARAPVSRYEKICADPAEPGPPGTRDLPPGSFSLPPPPQPPSPGAARAGRGGGGAGVGRRQPKRRSQAAKRPDLCSRCLSYRGEASGNPTLWSSRPGLAWPGPALWSSFGPLSWVCAVVWPLLTATSSSGTVQIPSKPRFPLTNWAPG